MAWVAFDRAVKFVEQLGLEDPVDRWRAVRDEIHADVCRQGFDPELGSFVQAYGSKALDASLLLLPIVGFLPPTDPRIVGTVRAIEHRLMRDGLVFRYDTEKAEDGLPPGEGAFLACSFWFVDNLILQGRLSEARAMFEHLLALRNDVGLLAEEYDPRAQRQMGNFPQAFSHVALVNTACNLTRRQGPAEQRADRRPAEAEKTPMPASPGRSRPNPRGRRSSRQQPNSARRRRGVADSDRLEGKPGTGTAPRSKPSRTRRGTVLGDPCSGLFANQGLNGLFHPSEHALLAAAHTF
jgi:hypothetical protein